MRRWLRQILVWVSFIIAVMTAATALRPINVYDGASIVIAGGAIEIGSYYRRIDVRYTRAADTIPGYPRLAVWYDRLPHPLSYIGDDTWRNPSFRRDRGEWYSDRDATITGTWWSIGLGIWYIVAAAMILPAWRTWRWLRRRRRSAEGHCPVCNYDLRATPDRCPECGTPITPPPV